MCQKRCSGRGTKLTLNRSGIDRNTCKQIRRSRSRNRHNAVGTTHRSLSYMYRRYNHLVQMKQEHGVADTCHIRHCIQSTHFMKMDFLHRTAMCFGFRVRNSRINGFCVILNLCRKFQMFNQVRNISRSCVVMRMSMMMVMRMIMVVAVMMVIVVMLLMMVFPVMFMMMFVTMMIMTADSFFFSVHYYFHVSSADTAGGSIFSFHPDIRQPQMIHCVQKCFFLFPLQKFV